MRTDNNGGSVSPTFVNNNERLTSSSESIGNGDDIQVVNSGNGSPIPSETPSAQEISSEEVEEASSEPSLENALKPFKDLINISEDNLYETCDEEDEGCSGLAFQGLFESLEKILTEYPDEIIFSEDFLREIRNLLTLDDNSQVWNLKFDNDDIQDDDLLKVIFSSRLHSLAYSLQRSLFEKIKHHKIMDKEAWINYFKNALRSIIQNKNNDIKNYYEDKIKMFLIIFGDDTSYCDALFDEVIEENQLLIEEGTIKEFKKNVLSLPTEPLPRHIQKLKSARNGAPQIDEVKTEAENLGKFLESQLLEEKMYRLILLLASLKSPNVDVEAIKRQIKEPFKELFSQNEGIAQELMNINQNFLTLFGSILFEAQYVQDLDKGLRLEIESTTSSDDVKPTEGKKEEKKESSE